MNLKLSLLELNLKAILLSVFQTQDLNQNDQKNVENLSDWSFIRNKF